MNKTVNIQKEKMNYSLVEQRQIPPGRGGRGPQYNNNFDQSVDKSRINVFMETSTAEKHAGINISYDNSFTAIKKDILKETVDKKRIAAGGGILATKEIIPIEEKPNKPGSAFMVHKMNTHTNAQELNLTQEIQGSNSINNNVEEAFNRTAAA